jgi:uncharacterized protein (DUF2062 family)
MRSRRARGQWESLRRLVRYRLMIPVFRSAHSAEFTARGVANGVFWGLTPTVGLQTLEIVATWFLGRRVFNRDSSLLQAMIWVWVNNPVTMIPMYYAFYVTGLWMVGQGGGGQGYEAFVALWTANATLSWSARLGAIVHAIGVPIFVGCLPYAIVGAVISYRWAVSVVRRRRMRIRTFREAN